MNPILALQTIISASKQHPWLLVLVCVALVAHGCDLQWPAYHALCSFLSRGFFGVALLYAGGSSVNGGNNQSTPADAGKNKPTNT